MDQTENIRTEHLEIIHSFLIYGARGLLATYVISTLAPYPFRVGHITSRRFSDPPFSFTWKHVTQTDQTEGAGPLGLGIYLALYVVQKGLPFCVLFCLIGSCIAIIPILFILYILIDQVRCVYILIHCKRTLAELYKRNQWKIMFSKHLPEITMKLLLFLHSKW